MNKIIELLSANDQPTIDFMNNEGFECIQIYTNGEKWFGLFKKYN